MPVRKAQHTLRDNPMPGPYHPYHEVKLRHACFVVVSSKCTLQRGGRLFFVFRAAAGEAEDSLGAQEGMEPDREKGDVVHGE